MNRWQNIQHVVVVGLGMTGLSVVNYLKKYHSEVTIQVIDTRKNPPGSEQLSSDIEHHFGEWKMDWLLAADLVVINPGIALTTPEVQKIIQSSIPVVGDIELFAWHVTRPVVAITGSNGKSTVTDLTGVLAKAAGLNVGVGGNIGVPALDLIDEQRDLYVLELSSFQLETTSNLALAAAALLNVTEDHMDRYHFDMEEYRQAKLRIFNHAKTAIVNGDDPLSFPEQFTGELVRFSLTQPVEYALITEQNKEYLQANGQRILAVDELNLVGRHNIANVLTVLALLDQLNVPYPTILDALKSYRGLTHRCQLVADNRGVQWVNDSKATNVASTLAALSGLSCAGKLYLLVGGMGKGADFSPLKPVLGQLNVELCCFGRDGDQFLPLHPSAMRYESMAQIVEAIAPKVQPGDMVMLSPACASMDQFKNFMERGDVFTQLARDYA